MYRKSRQLPVLVLLVFICVTFAPFLLVDAHAVDPVTVITVDSTDDDKADGNSKTCLNSTPCTLRRAINQAYSLSAVDRPVLIRFEIPESDAGYISYPGGKGAWKIKLDGTQSDELRNLQGSTIIDGRTQPNRRAGGPAIIIDGQKNHSIGFRLYNGNNSIYGLAMQNFKTNHIAVSSNNNLIDSCWFGLSDDGKHLSFGDDDTPEGGSGVVIYNANGNRIKKSVFAGFIGTACTLNGDNNTFTMNKVGTRADGTVPIPGQFDKHPCMLGGWVGGSGISVDGNDNVIGGSTRRKGNTFAGLYLNLSSTSTQGPAIKVYSGSGHQIKNNRIGVDAQKKAVGVCGRGLDLSSGPQDLNIKSNTFVDPGLSGIIMNNSQLNGNTLSANIIRRRTQWPGPQGDNPLGEDAIAYGPHVPDALNNFAPAQVTSIVGRIVSGTSGLGSPCPNCTVELLLDDDDGIKEALQRLAVTQADANGDWTVQINRDLNMSNGIRTMSTVRDTFTIPGLRTGTTSNMSEDLYMLPKPEISITAIDRVAKEPGSNKGIFKVRRTANNNFDTVVRYKVVGTAAPGQDYVALSGVVTIPAGANSALIVVKAKDDSKTEPNETVIVKLRANDKYIRKSPFRAKVIIKDND